MYMTKSHSALRRKREMPPNIALEADAATWRQLAISPVYGKNDEKCPQNTNSKMSAFQRCIKRPNLDHSIKF